MRRTRLRLALGITLLAIAPFAVAQNKKPPPTEVEDLGGDEPTKSAPATSAAPAKTATAAAPGPVEDLGGDESAKAQSPKQASDSGESVICQIDPKACKPQKLVDDYAYKDLKDSQVYAVQQIYALRNKRLEISPYWGVSLNDQFVSHPGPGLSVNYYITNVLAIGANFNFYQPFNSDAEFNKLVRQSTRLAVPINEYQFSANLNFTYVPLYGKLAGFGDFIFHWDAYVIGGIGAISTRPNAIIDPENRAFKYQPKVAFNVGVGLRVFFNRWLSAFLEVRDYIYSEKIENTTVAPAAPQGVPDITGTNRDPNTWIGESRLTNAIQAQFGISVFIPFTWTYKLPK